MPHQTNVRSNSSEPVNTRLPENVPTLGSLFSENGYEEMCIRDRNGMYANPVIIHAEMLKGGIPCSITIIGEKKKK